MVEAVVAIPFFLILLSGLLFVHRLYDAKLAAMRDAKAKAWSYATCGCGRGQDRCAAASQVEESAADRPEGYDPAVVGKVGKGPGAAVATRGWAIAESSIETSVVADKVLGAGRTRIAARAKVSCNESVENGSVAGWGEAAFGAFGGW
jgi:hypothetical protein